MALPNMTLDELRRKNEASKAEAAARKPSQGKPKTG